MISALQKAIRPGFESLVRVRPGSIATGLASTGFASTALASKLPAALPLADPPLRSSALAGQGRAPERRFGSTPDAAESKAAAPLNALQSIALREFAKVLCISNSNRDAAQIAFMDHALVRQAQENARFFGTIDIRQSRFVSDGRPCDLYQTYASELMILAKEPGTLQCGGVTIRIDAGVTRLTLPAGIGGSLEMPAGTIAHVTHFEGRLVDTSKESRKEWAKLTDGLVVTVDDLRRSQAR